MAGTDSPDGEETDRNEENGTPGQDERSRDTGTVDRETASGGSPDPAGGTGVAARVYALVPDAIRRSYARKLALSFLTVLLVIGLIGGQLYVGANAQLGASAEQRLSANANMHADQLDIWIDDSKGQTRMIAASESVRERDPVAMQSYFDSLIRTDRLTAGARAVHLVDRESTEILSSSLDGRIGGVARERGDPWAEEDLTAIEAGEVRVTAFQSPVVNVTKIAFVTPVPDRENRAIVYVASTQQISDQLHQSSETAFTTVVSADGDVMIDQLDSTRIGTAYRGGEGVTAPAVERGLDGESGFVVTEAENASTDASLATGYAAMETVDWVVLANDLESEVFALRTQISTGVLSLILVSGLGLALIGVTIGRNTVTSLRTLSERARSIEEGDLDTELASNRTDEIGRLFAAFDSMRASLQAQLSEAERAQREAAEARTDAEQARDRAAQARDEAEALLSHLQQKAEEYRTVMEAAADGDLTRRMTTESESEAMERIAESFNEMMAQLEETVAEVQSFAGSVSASTEQVAASTDEVRETAEEVSRSVQEISDGAIAQTEKITTATDEMNDLSATIEEVASSATEVADTSERAAERGVEGRSNGQQAVDVMETVDSGTDRAVATIEELDDRMQQVRDIVELIEGIADEVNILALNASIEAAHADGDGDGFAVVADEIKTLAAETQAATEDVKDVIDEIESQTSESVAAMQDTKRLVTDGVETVEETVEAIDEIVNTIEDANAGVQEINRATDEQAASTQTVVSMIDEISEISEDTAGEAETVAAAAQEQASALNEVSTSIDDLADRSQELQRLLTDFEVGDGTAVDTAGDGSRAGADDD